MVHISSSSSLYSKANPPKLLLAIHIDLEFSYQSLQSTINKLLYDGFMNSNFIALKKVLRSMTSNSFEIFTQQMLT